MAKKIAGYLKLQVPAGAANPSPPIAEAKMQDLNANDLEAAMRMVAGSARSMGLKVAE